MLSVKINLLLATLKYESEFIYKFGDRKGHWLLKVQKVINWISLSLLIDSSLEILVVVLVVIRIDVAVSGKHLIGNRSALLDLVVVILEHLVDDGVVWQLPELNVEVVAWASGQPLQLLYLQTFFLD